MNSHRPALLLTVLLAPLLAHAADAPPTMLTLDEALKELDAHNLTLAQAKAHAEETRAVVRQAMAALLPNAMVGGSYTRNNAEAKVAIGGLLDSIEGGLNKISPVQVTLDRSNVPADMVIQPLEGWNGQAAVKVPLWAGNAWPDYFAAKRGAEAAELSADAARLKLRTALVQAASWSGAVEDIAAASERALTIAKEHEASAQRAVIAGTAAPLSELQARTEVVRRESDVVRTQADRARSWLALGVLLGRAEPVRVTMAVPTDTLPDADDQLQNALQLRPELKAQAAMLSSADWQLRSSWLRLAPTVSASFAAVTSNVNYATGLNYGWKASVDLTWVLYDGGFRYGKRRQAEGAIAAARAGLAQQTVEVKQQVLDARRDAEVAAQRMTLAQKQLALAKEVAASADRSFEAGLASSLDVLDANDKLYMAEVGLAEAKAKVGMASAALMGATGSLLER